MSHATDTSTPVPAGPATAAAPRATVLVFDSGVGGLSVLGAIQQQLPDQHWIFCSDNAFFPYGTKSETQLVNRVCTVLDALQQRYQPDVIVLACNTASTVALDAARRRLPVPVIGVVPAIKPAAALTQSRVIGLLATPGTISRPYTRKLIDDFAPQCEVVRVGSSELVWMAEDTLRERPLDDSRLYDILEPLRTAICRQGLDTVVLACTHFPLLQAQLQEQLPQVLHWVDSGAAVARRVVWQLQQTPPTACPVAENLALFTRLDDSARELLPALQQFGLCQLAQLDLPAETRTDD